MDQITSEQLPVLLARLGKMTSIRDTELLEQSLLKTLEPLLGILETSLYRTDEAHALVRIIHHHRSKVTGADGVARVVERVEEMNNILEVSTDVLTLLDSVRMLSKPCTRKVAQGLLVAYPLFAAGEVCGFFVFQRDREVSPLEDATIRGVLDVFSNYYELLDSSQRDRLTGLLNRQALEQSFERIWELLARFGSTGSSEDGRRKSHASQYWLAVMDIDHFKQVNDSHGHIIGDEILLLVSRLMTKSFRSTDLLYRYGGEEFVAIVSAESEAIARTIFERVRLSIEAYSFPQVEHVAISGGYSRIDPSILPQEVLNRADRTLYQAKRDGRNRMYEFEELVRTGVFQEIGFGSSELF